RERIVGRGGKVRPGAGAHVGREGDGLGLRRELVFGPVHVGDQLDRAAARGVVAVIGRAEIVEEVVAGAAGNRVDRGAALERVVALVPLDRVAAASAHHDAVADTAEYGRGAADGDGVVAFVGEDKGGRAPGQNQIVTLATAHGGRPAAGTDRIPTAV